MNKNLKNQINTNIFEYIKHKQKESSLEEVVTALINDFVIYTNIENKKVSIFNEILYYTFCQYEYFDYYMPNYVFERYNLLNDIDKDVPDYHGYYTAMVSQKENILSNLYYGNKYYYYSRNYSNIRFLFNLSINKLHHNCPMLHDFEFVLFDCANELLKDENVFMRQSVYDCVRTVVMNTLIKIQEKEKEIK